MPTSPSLPAPGCTALNAELFSDVAAEPARRRLLLAGLNLFAEQGYAKTSIRQIALEAEVNVAAISYYFGGKEGLYKAVFWGGKAPVDDEHSWAPSQLDSLEELFQRILAPLHSGKAARAWTKLQRREMLEPTGLWQQKVDRGMVPMHAALIAYLCRRLGLKKADDELQALALLVIGPAVHLLMNCEIVDMLSPQLLAGADAVDVWHERLVRSAEAVIAAERRRRLKAGPAVRSARTGASSIRSSRSKA